MTEQQTTFKLNLQKHDEIQLPPKRIITTSDVYKYVQLQKYTKNDLILYYVNTPIPKNIEKNLIDIGYDPYKPFSMLPCECKKCEFKISKYNFSFSIEVFDYQTFFDAKKLFAEKFYTISQNILIKKNSDIMSNESKILDNGSFFEIDVVKGYSLYYIFFFDFLYICLPDKLTFNELKIALAGCKNYYFNGIMLGDSLSKIVNGDDQIKNYITNIRFLDFKFQCDNQPSAKIKVYIETANDKMLAFDDDYHCNSFDKPTKNVVNWIKYMIESKYCINKEKIIHYDDPQHCAKNTIYFYSLDYIYVTVAKKPEKFPYLITIEELKKKYNDINTNVGFIINDSFVFEEKDFLAKYLSNPVNNEQTRMQINIVRPDTKCRLCQIQSGKKMKMHSLIIPTFYTFNNIATRYYRRRANSMQFFSGLYSTEYASNPVKNTDKIEQFNSTQFHAIITKDLIIKYQFYNKKKEYKIKMSNEDNPQIKNLIFEIFKEEKNKEQCNVYDVYVKYVEDKLIHIDFWEYLIEYVDQTLIIKKCEYDVEKKIPNEKFIRVYDATTNVTVKYNFEHFGINAKCIIKDTHTTKDAKNYSLYMNFHKLCPDDMPLLLYQPYDFLILNSNEPEREFLVTNNEGISEKLKIGFDNNQYISAIIINRFYLMNKDVRFELKLDSEANFRQKESILPPGFDAGSIPNNSTIVVKYKVLETGEYIFEYKSSSSNIIKKKVFLSDSKKTIRGLRKEVIEKLKIFNISPKVIAFEFLGNKLDQDKTFLSYGIAENSIITVTYKEEDTLRVGVFLFDPQRKVQDTKLGDYYFKSGKKTEDNGTIEDVIEQLRLEYKLDEDSKLKIYSQPDTKSLIKDVKKQLKDGEKLYASFEKIKIRLFNPKGEKIEIDEIVKPTKEFIEEKILTRIPPGSVIKPSNLILYKTEGKAGHYVPVDGTKSFKENGETEYYAFNKLTNITFYFRDTEIKLADEFKIPEFESIRSVIKYYLSDKILASPGLIKLAIKNGTEINQNETIGNMIRILESQNKKIEIRFNDSGEDVESPKSDKSKKTGKLKLKVSKFKPKTSSTDLINKTQKEESPKRSNQKGDSSSSLLHDDDDDDEERNHKEDENLKLDSQANESSKSSEMSNESKQQQQQEEQHQDQQDAKIEEEEEAEGNDDSSKPTSGAEKAIQNSSNEIVEEEEEVDGDDDSSKPTSGADKASQNSSNEIVEEEEENDDEEDEGDTRTHKFVIKGKEPFYITKPKDATVKEYLDAIAENKDITADDVTADDVAIIFSGKKLRRKTILANMKIAKNEEINVIISEPQDILLRTAKALKIIPSDINDDDDDDDYEYEYYDEEEDKEK